MGTDVAQEVVSPTRGQRASNMELLRIVAMAMIILFHSAFKGGFEYEALSPNTFGLKMLWMLGETGVNLFMLVSGYFQITGRFKGTKLVSLIAQIAFYAALCYVMLYITGVAGGGFLSRFLAIGRVVVGGYWFFDAYLVIYLFSPYLNRLARGLGREGLAKFVALSLFLWCVLATVFGVAFNNSEAVLGFNRLGWFVVLYLFGALLRLYPPRWLASRSALAAITGAGVILWAISIVVIATHPGFFGRFGLGEWAYFWHPNAIPTLMVSVGVFGLFASFDIGSVAAINRISSTCLGVYLFHDGVLAGSIWKRFAYKALAESWLLVPSMLLGAVVLFAVGAVVDLARQGLFALTLDRWLRSDSFAGLCGRLSAWAERATHWLLD